MCLWDSEAVASKSDSETYINATGLARDEPGQRHTNFAAAPETYKQFAAEGGERSSLASLARLRAQLARFARSLASFVD